MCIIITKETSPGDIQITCKLSGKPISVTNKAGMFCEDLCQIKESEEALDDLIKLLDIFDPDKKHL